MKCSREMFCCYARPVLLLVLGILTPGLAPAQETTTGIACSEIAARHLRMQDNMRAGLTLIQCGVLQGGNPNSGHQEDEDSPQPPNILVSTRVCTSNSSCTRSESVVAHSTAAGSNLMVANFNDHIGNNFSGTSYSTDNGNTWIEISPPPFQSGHGMNYGDPILGYNQKLGKFFAGDLTQGCGNLGIGLWSSPDGQNWTAAGCIHVASGDRPSMWMDNNPLSRRYGRMYVSYNDFSVDSGALFVVYSDDGDTWSAGSQLTTTFIRDVQLTGTPPGILSSTGASSTVFLAAMDEGGGGLSPRQNIIFRSTDGGATWTQINVGQLFTPPGDSTCGYFGMINPIWRHQGWGQPAVGPHGVVHYAYAGKGALSTGDIFYTRSTDNGITWSTPIVLNDPETNQYQSHWMPSLSVNYNTVSSFQPEDVTVSWYDRRQATTTCNRIGDAGCNYQRYGIQSHDNGNTWGPNFEISNGIIPQPAQDDGSVSFCYAGDYDYSTALNNHAFITWTDGRVAVQGVQVQSVFFAAVPEP